MHKTSYVTKLTLLVVISLLLTSSVYVRAEESTGAFLNRIFGKTIATTNRVALEGDLFSLESRLHDIVFVETNNEITEEAHGVALSLSESRAEFLLQLSNDFEELLNSYHFALLGTDLDLIIRTRSHLQNFLREHEVSYRVGINATNAMFSPVLLQSHPDSVEYLTLQIHRLRSQIRTLEDSVNYGQIPLAWPVDGRFTSGFGVRTDPFTGRPAFHTGVDLGAPTGTPVFAWFNGTVIFADNSGGWGNTVLVRQGDLMVRYAHLHRIEVSVGDILVQGNRIGTVGSTGRSTAPHLHLGLYIQGIAVDPQRVLGG